MRRYLRAVRQYSSLWGTGRFLRVKAILSAAVVKVPRVPAYVLLYIHPPRRQSRRLRRRRGWRVAVDITGRVKRGCSVSGISSWDRKRHFVPSCSTPHREVGSAPANDHRRDVAGRYEGSTRSQPLPLFSSTYPSRSSFASVSSSHVMLRSCR